MENSDRRVIRLNINQSIRLSDKPDKDDYYVFRDIDTGKLHLRYKHKTYFKTPNNVGDTAFLLSITESYRGTYHTQNYTLVIGDKKYARNMYFWLLRHNPSMSVDWDWSNKNE